MHDEQDQWSTWMQAAQAGDGVAYQLLLQAILPRIRAIVGRRVSDPQRGEDVIQEVLLSVHKNRHTFDPKLKFSPWLQVIAERRAMDYLRKVYRTGAVEVLVDEYPETFMTDGANTIEEKALAFIDADQLRAAVAELPIGQRRAVELLKLKEMSLKEASLESGMTVAALKVSMHRAMKALKLKMNTVGE